MGIDPTPSRSISRRLSRRRKWTKRYRKDIPTMVVKSWIVKRNPVINRRMFLNGIAQRFRNGKARQAVETAKIEAVQGLPLPFRGLENEGDSGRFGLQDDR